MSRVTYAIILAPYAARRCAQTGTRSGRKNHQHFETTPYIFNYAGQDHFNNSTTTHLTAREIFRTKRDDKSSTGLPMGTTNSSSWRHLDGRGILRPKRGDESSWGGHNPCEQHVLLMISRQTVGHGIPSSRLVAGHNSSADHAPFSTCSGEENTFDQTTMQCLWRG